jgi:organic radical activating enzyme
MHDKSPARRLLSGLSRRAYNSPLKRVYHRLSPSSKRRIGRVRDFLLGEGTPFEKIPHVIPVLKCNLDCGYCSDGLAHDKSYMNFERLDYQRWADILNGIPGDAVIFTGGEPTVYRYLPELINALNKTDIRIYSNLVFSVERFMDKLEKPVTFFTSFRPNNPSVTFENNLAALKAVMAHPCAGVCCPTT